MRKRVISKWTKEIFLGILLMCEIFFSFIGYVKKWPFEIYMSLLFADVLTLFNTLMSIVNKFDGEYCDMQNKIEKEHTEIKGAIELYNDIEELTYISYFEGAYVQEHNARGAEIWIISNSVEEPENVLEEMAKNLVEGASYYYVIPNDSTEVKSLENSVSELSKIVKRSYKRANPLSIKYIQDDLFDFLPTDIVSILYYCTPTKPDRNEDMMVFYSFHNEREDGKIFYKPIKDSNKARNFFKKMEEWKQNRKWKEMRLEN